MAIPSARRPPDQLTAAAAKQATPPSSLAILGQTNPSATGASHPVTPQSNQSPSIHHQHFGSQQPSRNKRSVAYFKGHQRRQSVARLLPDISKLRLLSWLVEASSELINCDIAIMDGVYAKLNKSQESLLFWAQSSSTPMSTPTGKPPQPPRSQPVANKIVISQRKQQQLFAGEPAAAKPRNHHSLPITNYDASSLAAVSCGSSSLGGPRPSRSIDTDSILSGTSRLDRPQSILTDAIQADLSGCDSEDDDDNSSASSTTTSGTQGVGTSLSSASSSASSSSSCSSGSRQRNIKKQQQHRQQHQQQLQQPAQVSSAGQLSEKIRRTVMEHNYLQSLLVNIIRQHDRQSELMNKQMCSNGNLRPRAQRIDLAAIADALDDGCLCTCHSERRPSSRSSTLPGSLGGTWQQDSPINNPKVPSRKVRRLKKIRGGSSSQLNEQQLNKQDLIHLLADRLCENCFETHYWLRACAIDEPRQSALLQPRSVDSAGEANAGNVNANQLDDEDLNALVARRNATFIKLVQQEVRSIISKSIELVDLIRREIKSPEFIKQKQLMRCFSASIQLLTSVGNYVVPSQDISSFIPEVDQQQTQLFCLPPSDFDHLLLYQHHHQTTSSNDNFSSHRSASQQALSSAGVNGSGAGGSNSNSPNTTRATSTKSNYHLASAPDIPIRRRSSGCTNTTLTSTNENKLQPQSDSNASYSPAFMPNNNSNTNCRLLSSNVQRLRASDYFSTNNNKTTSNVTDSSSGVSSNNSSASSSIARGGVQQSSLTRAQTASAILDGKTSHELSTFETIASLSRQQTEDDMMFQARPKFWQSSKFNFIKKLLHVKQQRLLRQQSKDRRIYNNKVQNKFRLVMMDLTHFNKSQQLLTTENGVNSLLTSMRNVLEFGLYLTLKLY